MKKSKVITLRANITSEISTFCYTSSARCLTWATHIPIVLAEWKALIHRLQLIVSCLWIQQQ